MPAAQTKHQWTATDNALEVSGEMREADRPVTWLRDEEAVGQKVAAPPPAKPT